MPPATLCCVPPKSVERANQLGYAARRSEAYGVNTRRAGGAYQGALEATLAVVISVLLGVWADTTFDTSPAFFVIGLAVGFGAFILRLTRLLREAGEPDDHKNGTNGTNGNSQDHSQRDRDPDL